MRIPYKKYLIKTANPTGGKAGKGLNKTSTIQVMNPKTWTLDKQIRYSVSVRGDLERAIQAAKDWIDGKPPKRGGARSGSGQKSRLEGAASYNVNLDSATVEGARDLGKGILSAGLRRAVEIAKKTQEEE